VDPLEIEDTSDWLGCPTELETCAHYLRMLENEIQELNLQLRKSRENIFGLVQMYTDASAQRDEAMRNLREKSGQLAIIRKELYDLNITAKGNKREADRLRGILEGLIDRPKTII
jgi:chromosome segregation ATPase